MKKKTKIFAFLIISFIIICIFISMLNRCSVLPWKTIQFISCKEHIKLQTKSGFDQLTEQYSDSECNGVFMYTVSNGFEDTMYSTKEPYAFTFVFYHYDTDITIRIKSLTIINDNNEQLPVTLKFPVEISTDYFINYKDLSLSDFIKSDYLTGHIKTDYIYKLKECKNLSIEMEIEVNNNGKKETKVLKQKLSRQQKTGVFQYGF